MDTEAGLDIPAGGIMDIRPGGPIHLIAKATRPGLTTSADIPMTFRFGRAALSIVSSREVEDMRAAWVAAPVG